MGKGAFGVVLGHVQSWMHSVFSTSFRRGQKWCNIWLPVYCESAVVLECGWLWQLSTQRLGRLHFAMLHLSMKPLANSCLIWTCFLRYISSFTNARFWLNLWLNVLGPKMIYAISVSTLLVGRQEGHPACKKWVVRRWCGYLSGARCRLAYAQLMPLPLTVSCFSKIQCFTFLVPAHQGSSGKRAVKRVMDVCVCACVRACVCV